MDGSASATAAVLIYHTALSKLPGKQELIAMTLGTMNAVPTNFVSLFANMIRGLLYALNGVKEKKEAA